MYHIHFQDPNKRLNNERRSKLISQNSDLYAVLELERKRLLEWSFGKAKISDKRMDYHIELIKENELTDEKSDTELLVQRAQLLEDTIISLDIKYSSKTVYVETPVIEGYGPTHITIAYFPNGVPKFS